MTSTVTVSMVSAVASDAFVASIGMVLAFTLLVLLIKKEVLLTSNRPIVVQLRRLVNIALVPMLTAFVMIAGFKLWEVLR